MDRFKIIINGGAETEVDGIFYLYNSKYYFTYTQKEIDENGYVVFHLVQVGKEIQNTPNGPLDTGYMIGMEISDPEEWKNVQGSITKIVEDKKNGTQSDQIQYLPQNMLSILKVISSKKFRLAKNVVEENLKLNIENAMQNPMDASSTLTETPQSNVVPVQIGSEISAPVDLSNQQAETPITLNSTPLGKMNSGNSLVDDTVASSLEMPQPNDISQNTAGLNIENDDESIFATPLENTAVTPQNDVIIDYRAKFFEEQEKNQQLEQQLKEMTDKLESIKSIIG